MPYHRVIARKKRKNSRHCQKSPLFSTLLSSVWWHCVVLRSASSSLAPSIPTSAATFTSSSLFSLSFFILYFTYQTTNHQSTRLSKKQTHIQRNMGVLEKLSRKTGVIVGDDVLELFKYAQEKQFAIPAIVRVASVVRVLDDSIANRLERDLFFYCRRFPRSCPRPELPHHPANVPGWCRLLCRKGIPVPPTQKKNQY